MTLIAMATDDEGRVVATQEGHTTPIAEWTDWCDRMEQAGFAVRLLDTTPASDPGVVDRALIEQRPAS